MAEKPSPRRAQGSSGSLNRRAGGTREGATPPSGFVMTAATEFTALAGRSTSWAALGALAIIALLFAGTLALVLDPVRAPRASNRPIGIWLPLPAEPSASANSSGPSAPPEPNAPPDNPRAAADWYLARATGGDPAAQYELAVRYATGRGVAKDDTRAAAWFREAAINGIAAAQYDLGILYDNGRGLPRDPIEAMIWYQSAADQGEAIAQLRLGTIYLAGGVVPRNPQEATRWLRRAAEQGVAEAQAMLAARYQTGDGAVRSDAAAYGWYSLAAAAGLAEARAAKTRLAAGFSPKELDEAEHDAARLAAQVAQGVGVASQSTDGLLLTTSPIPPPGPGSPGAVPRGAISEIQRLLGASGYDTGPADGFPGEQTIQAIRRYQQDVGLIVDGSPGLALLNRLRAAAAGPPPAAQP